MNNKKLKIGITGGLGSGKSLFAEFLTEKNFTVLSADEIAKDLISNDKSLIKKIKETFGEESYTNGILNKKYLAEKVFTNANNTLLMNSLVHPEVIKLIEKKSIEILKKENIVFTEAALIYEAEMEDFFDYIVLITADKKTKLQRAKVSKKMNEKDAEARIAQQIDDEEKKNRADFIFENNGTKEDLKNKATFFINIMKGL